MHYSRHPGFVTHCLSSMDDIYGKIGKFTIDDWISWKIGNFETAINNSRAVLHIRSLSRNNPGWQKVVCNLLEEEPQKLIIEADTPEDRLVKSGLICHA